MTSRHARLLECLPFRRPSTVNESKGFHVHLLQSDALKALGNRNVTVNGVKVLELKCHNTAVAAPGCVFVEDDKGIFNLS